MKKQKSYGFVLTDWNLNNEEKYLAIMKKYNIRYIAYGEEICPTNGKKHNQAFLYFHNERSYTKKNLGQMGKWWGEIHCNIEPMYGNFQQNEVYCSKEGIYKKIGDEPKQGFRGDLKETMRLITIGEIKPYDILVENPETFNLYKNSFSIARNLFLKNNFRTKMTKGFWIWGGTGVGKSHMAYKNFHPTTHFKKDLNIIWWDNYEQQKFVIFNEFRGQVKYSELLDLCDKYPKDVPIRNNPSVPFTSEVIIITSCSPPEKIYFNKLDDEDNIKQFERRFEVIHLKEQSDAEVVYW